ncbi:unnamed protein product [Chrysodeixis includens]|uniref:Uncharacterized protein n=1 Tax=Chrysodeixis includens TaxID=689277 RepID=A0A9N8L586_CHRIL|nr:unnamed protein product [Chrysodeixis includens]
MAAKSILILCAQSLLIQSAFSQCLGRSPFDNFNWPASGLNTGLAGSGLTTGLAGPGFGFPAGFGGLTTSSMEFSPTSGGGLAVNSGSVLAPVGISVMSENGYEGVLSVAGELPFVGTTGVDGLLPTAGSGAINHNCGNGMNAMSALSATSTPASVASAGAPAFAAPGLAYNGPLAPGYTPGFAPGFGPTAFGASGLAAPCNAGFAGRGLGVDSLAYSPFDVVETTPTSGGALPVSSASAVPPTGIAVASENVYEGPLAAGGELPFVGTVAVDGLLPTAGAGAVNHACGNGRNAMISEGAAFSPAAAGYAGLGGIAPGLGAPFGYPAGLGSFANPNGLGSLAYPAGLAGAAAPGLGLRGGFAGRGCGVL